MASTPHLTARADISDGKHTCTKCGERKALSDFPKRKSRPLGVTSTCKLCIKVANKVAYSLNAEINREYAANYRRNNAEAISVKQAEYREANRDALRKYHREYAKANPGKVMSKIVHRRAKKLSATPKWADKAEIQSFYDAARLLSKGWHVDHIVPLVHPLVCGLHCEANLQLIPALENLRKGNNYWPDMPTTI